MKLIAQFNTFLDEEVNLNSTRVDLLTSSVEAVQRAIKESDWKPKILAFGSHGSWAHGTIIKPLPSKEFDADLLVMVEPVPGWEAKDYVNSLVKMFEEHPVYKDKVKRYSHCATIEYAGVRRIDVAPCVKSRQWAGYYEVCNRTTNAFERSEPIKYTDWVKSKNGVAGGNDLKKVTRLLKYLRDIKKNFTCPSFLFTTLVGLRINESDRNTAAFADTPTCLKTIIGRLDDWLQNCPSAPTVYNPVLPSEPQSGVWDDDTKYKNFREKIHTYREWIDDAYNEEDKAESIAKWQRVFGEAFAASDVKESAKVSESVVKRTALALEGHFDDLVALIKARGRSVIPTDLVKLPYVHRPKWKSAPTQMQMIVKVMADLRDSKGGTVIRKIASGDLLPNHHGVHFVATNVSGLPFSADYKVEWRVTNTDQAAINAGALRGDFYPSDKVGGVATFTRDEELAYRGVHFVQAFLVKKSDNKLYGESDPFHVVVE